MREDPLRIGEDLGHLYGDAEFVNLEVWVGRDHGAPREVNTLARQVATEAALRVGR